MVLGCHNAIVIPEDRFNAIATARRCLLEALAIEEKIDLVRDNYTDLEQVFLDLTLQHQVYGGWDWPAAVAEVRLVNRHLVNLLSTCRMYVDHLPQHLGAIYGDHASEVEAFTSVTRKEFESHLGYRTLYALRNYVQHSGWPIQSISHRSEVVGCYTDQRCRATTTGYLHVKDLIGSQFKKQTLADLMAIGDRVDIKPLVREGVASHGRIHATVRRLLQPYLPAWETLIVEAINEYSRAFGPHTEGLAAVSRSQEGGVIESHSLFVEFIERRKYLEKRNQMLEVDGLCYISSESFGKA